MLALKHFRRKGWHSDNGFEFKAHVAQMRKFKCMCHCFLRAPQLPREFFGDDGWVSEDALVEILRERRVAIFEGDIENIIESQACEQSWSFWCS